ncbi:MAG: Fur family transcriptional regulator [Planctomycetia bacterium]
MDTSPDKRTNAESLKSLIRQAGLRCTVARLAVLEHMLAVPGPQTHAEVSAALDHRGFDRATIDRNLTELTEARLVTRVDLGDHVWRFEARRQGDQGGPHQGDHPHFVCTTCGEVSCLDDVNVAITPRPGAERPGGGGSPHGAPGSKGSGLPSVTEVVLKGTCGNCGEDS